MWAARVGFRLRALASRLGPSTRTPPHVQRRLGPHFLAGRLREAPLPLSASLDGCRRRTLSNAQRCSSAGQPVPQRDACVLASQRERDGHDFRRAWKMAFFFGPRPVGSAAAVALPARRPFALGVVDGVDDGLTALTALADLTALAGWNAFGAAVLVVRPFRPKNDVSDRRIFRSAWTTAVGTSLAVALALRGVSPAGRASTRHRLSDGPDRTLLMSLR